MLNKVGNEEEKVHGSYRFVARWEEVDIISGSENQRPTSTIVADLNMMIM